MPSGSSLPVVHLYLDMMLTMKARALSKWQVNDCGGMLPQSSGTHWGCEILPKVFSVIEPSTKELIEELQDDVYLEAGRGKVRLGSFVRLAKFMVPNFLKTMKYFVAPTGKAEEIQQKADAKSEELAEAARDADSLEQSVHLYREIF